MATCLGPNGVRVDRRERISRNQARSLLVAVSDALDRHSIPPSRFGRMAVKDPAFVTDLRNEREVRPALEQRIRAFIAKLDREATL